ncbi:MAG: ArnT family glycosyltransferase [Candidatus Poribacteria bacterium]
MRYFYAIIRKIDYYIIFILLVGLAVFVLKCLIVYPIQYVGHADASGYAEMADSLIHGRGLAVDYISFYFLKYPRIVRPEDHWPPLYSFFIAPFFLIMGKTAFAAKLPSLIISSLLFPIVGYFLGQKLSKSRITGLTAALTILFYPNFFTHSLYCLSDITFAFMVSLTVLFAIKGVDDGRYFYPMGVCLALAYYAKGSSLALIPAFVIFYLICHSSNGSQDVAQSNTWRNVIKDNKFLRGLGLTFLVLLPWFIRNTIHFHNPIFSTQQFCAGYIGYQPWETGTYSLYWGENLPSFLTKFRYGVGTVAQNTLKFFKQYLWWAFIDIGKSTGKFKQRDFYTYITGIPAALGLIMLFISSLYALFVKAVRRFSTVRYGISPFLQICSFLTDAAKETAYGQNRYLHIVWLVILFHFLFLSLCWDTIERLTFPASSLVIVTGWVIYHTILKNIFNWSKYSKQIVAILLIVGMMPVVWYSGEAIYRTWQTSGYPYREGGQEWMDAGRWLKTNAPGSVTMTRNPWELHFYSEQKAIQIPLAGLDKVIEVAKFYGATHLIPFDGRPALQPWINGEREGLKLVYDKGLKIYEIRIPR